MRLTVMIGNTSLELCVLLVSDGTRVKTCNCCSCIESSDSTFTFSKGLIQLSKFMVVHRIHTSCRGVCVCVNAAYVV